MARNMNSKKKTPTTKPKYPPLDWSQLDELANEGEQTRDQSAQSHADGDVLLQPLRQKSRAKPLPEAVADAVERNRHAGCETQLPPFGRRTFRTAYEFLDAWRTYEEVHHLRYRTRHSKSAEADNAERIRRRDEQGLERTPEFLATLVPRELGYKMISKRCTHGCYQEARGTGKRNPTSTRFRDCGARITALALQQSDGTWAVQTRQEVIVHNHDCTQQESDSYVTMATVDEAGMTSELRAMVMAKAPARNICDVFTMETGVPLTAQRLANLKRDRLGGQSAIDNLRLLLQRFSTFEGSRCLIVNDQDDQMCGIVMQSSAQRAMLEKWGDNLLLDWTHNTNNIGYYLGSLMITSVTGRGVSVLDFLCFEQTQSMMRAVLSFFVRVNPRVTSTVRAIVIDKDYNEWRVLLEIFPNARVLLCQFHVLKWFSLVVTDKKYGMEPELQLQVREIIHAMVYARTVDIFQLLVQRLDDLLADASPAFLAFMREYWYSCRDMWSACERATVFTALNTTTNRLESSWNQLKQMLRGKLRIDLCVEAIFAYQTAVMRREYSLINAYSSRLVLRSNFGPFLRWAMAEVSEYCATEVAEQWRLYRANEQEYVAVEVEGAHLLYTVSRLGPDCPEYQVNALTWVCSCEFNVTGDLPCRHLIYVARDKLRLDRFPVAAVAPRWLMAGARDILVPLRKSTSELQSLRTGHLLAEAKIARMVQGESSGSAEELRAVTRRVAQVSLRRGEQASNVVLNNIEKRAVVNTRLQRVIDYLMQQSNERFRSLIAQLEDVVDNLLQSWQPQTDAASDLDESTSDIRWTDDIDVDQAVADAVLLDDSQYLDGADHQLRLKRQAQEQDLATQFSSQLQPDNVLSEHLHRELCLASSSGSAEPSSQSECHEQDGASPPRSVGRSSPVTSPSVSAVTAFLDTIGTLNDDQQQAPPSTVASSDISAVIDSVARFHLETERGKQAAPKRDRRVLKAAVRSPAPDHRHGTQYLASRRTLNSTANSLELSWNQVKQINKRTSDAAGLEDMCRTQDPQDGSGALEEITLRVRSSAGTTKKQKNVRGRGQRRVSVPQTTDCPISIGEMISALMHTEDISRISSLWCMYPRLMDDKFLLRREASAGLATVVRASFALNYAIPREIVDKLDTAMADFAEAHSKTTSGASRVTLDLSNPDGSVQCVARLPQLRPFSEENVAELKQFYTIPRLSELYKLDEQWVRESTGEAPVAVFYLQQELEAVCEAEQWPSVHEGIRNDLRAALKLSTLETRFAVQATKKDLAMSISVRDILGRLARQMKLNDAVLMYALKQMAGHCNDVQIFDSLGVAGALPESSLQGCRLTIFPVNFPQEHWSVICVRIDKGRRAVHMYDPCQGAYETLLAERWSSVYKPLLDAWATRDQVDVHEEVLAFVRRQRQMDSVSCGVYCLALAHEFVEDGYHHAARSDDVPALLTMVQVKEMRVRVMWRIFRGSQISNDQAERNAAAETLERLRRSTSDTV